MAGCDILLVEDDEETRSAMQALLEGEGLLITAAQHGGEALEALREVRPKAILLDLMMPVMSGWKLIESIRGNPNLAAIPIVALTAGAASRPKGCSGFLNKPFSRDALLRMLTPYVGALLQKRR